MKILINSPQKTNRIFHWLLFSPPTDVTTNIKLISAPSWIATQLTRTHHCITNSLFWLSLHRFPAPWIPSLSRKGRQTKTIATWIMQRSAVGHDVPCPQFLIIRSLIVLCFFVGKTKFCRLFLPLFRETFH